MSRILRRCQGPAGEPGYAAEIDGELSECFTYVEGDTLSTARAMTCVSDLLQGTEPPARPRAGSTAPGAAWWVRFVVVPISAVAALVLMAVVADMMDDPLPRASPGDEPDICYDQMGPYNC